MTIPPEPPRRKKKVEVRHIGEWTIEARQRKSRFKQRKVEGSPVVCDDQLKWLEQFGKGEQHRRLFIEIANEKLNHVELITGEISQADKERTYADTALHPGGF